MSRCNFKQSFKSNWLKVFETQMIPRILGGNPDCSLNQYKANGISLLIFVNFYTAVDTLLTEIYRDLLLTHRDMYIVQFRNIKRFKLSIMYNHIVFRSLVREYQIEIDKYVMENFIIMQKEIVQIMLAAKQLDDSPFSKIIF